MLWKIKEFLRGLIVISVMIAAYVMPFVNMREVAIKSRELELRGIQANAVPIKFEDVKHLRHGAPPEQGARWW
jgi:hypothetical protein